VRKYTFLLLLIPALALAYTYTVDPDTVWFESSQGYAIPRIPGGVYSNDVGDPHLPWLPLRIAVPPGLGAAEVEVASMTTVELPGSYSLFPEQEQRPISKPGEFVEYFSEVYNSDDPYPAGPLTAAGGGNIAGVGVADLVFCPFIYHPASGRLELITGITFDVALETLPYEVRTRRVITPYTAELTLDRVRRLVLNPEAVNIPIPLSEPKLIGTGFEANYNEPDVGGTAEWVLITREEFAETFLPLVEWKLKKGLTTALVTVEYIIDTYEGRDQAEKIRNFIIDAFENWSTTYVVLGGDCAYVRERRGFVANFGSADDNMIPCDLYYSDLDGDWNADGDDLWGEYPADEVDLYADMFVSRFPVNSVEEAEAVVSKTLIYEKSIPGDFPLHTIFFAGKLDNIPTWGGDGKDQVATHLPPDFPYNYFYQRDMSYTAADIITEFESGRSAVVNQLHHSYYDVIGAGSDYINTSDAYAMTNGDYTGWFYAQGCMCGGFDRERCAGEGLVLAPNGGSVAVMFNSRYGLYQPGDPTSGSSNVLDEQFYVAVFSEDLTSFGTAQAFSKDYFVPLAKVDIGIRWCMYVQNVLGPCETASWCGAPEDLVVTHPSEWDEGAFTVTVSTDSRGPLRNARVCLYKEEDVYLVGFTRASGEVTFYPEVGEDGELSVTVSFQDTWPYEGVCQVEASSGAEVAEFTGGPTEEGALLSWNLIDGGDLAGLNVYREDTRLNSIILRAESGRYLDRAPGEENDYYLELVHSDGTATRVGPVQVVMPEWMGRLILSEPYPSPACDRVYIEFELPAEGGANLAVYDLSGRRVATLVDGELGAGRHTFAWDCADASPGVYICRLNTEGGVLTKRLVITR
jgi:hypothetical protein